MHFSVVLKKKNTKVFINKILRNKISISEIIDNNFKVKNTILLTDIYFARTRPMRHEKDNSNLY